MGIAWGLVLSGVGSNHARFESPLRGQEVREAYMQIVASAYFDTAF